MEGTRKGLWMFRNRAAGERLVREYLERDKPTPLDEPLAAAASEVVIQAKS
jgi:curli production assembly/transport component CsgG